MSQPQPETLLKRLMPLNGTELAFKRFIRENPEMSTMSNRELREFIQKYIGRDISSEAIITEDSLIPDKANLTVMKHMRYLHGCFHSHDFFEISCVMSGACVYRTPEKSVEIRAGDVVIFPPKNIHSIEVFSDECVLMNILIHSSTFDRYFYSLFTSFEVLMDFWIQSIYGKQKSGYLLCHCGDDEDISICVLRMYVESMERTRYCSQMLDALLHMFLITLLQKHEQDIIVSNPESRKDDKNILRIVNFTSREYQSLTLTRLAEEFHYSERQMMRVLKEYTGMGFGDYIQDIKLKKAVALLERSSVPVQSIAKTVGYSETSYFYRVFKKRYGCTPAEYRDRILK